MSASTAKAYPVPTGVEASMPGSFPQWLKLRKLLGRNVGPKYGYPDKTRAELYTVISKLVAAGEHLAASEKDGAAATITAAKRRAASAHKSALQALGMPNTSVTPPGAPSVERATLAGANTPATAPSAATERVNHVSVADLQNRIETLATVNAALASRVNTLASLIDTLIKGSAPTSNGRARRPRTTATATA